MDLKTYYAPLLKWWWMILAAGLIAAAASFVITLGQPAMYQSRTTLIIGQSLTNPNPSTSQFLLEQQLASIYADMATREPVRRAVMESLNLNWLPQYTSQALPDTQLIEIVVTDADPIRAQAVAAELANQLIKRGPSGNQEEDAERQAFIDQQLSTLEQSISDTTDELEELKITLGNLSSASQISDTQQQINALENKLRSLQENYARLLSSSSRGALNTLSVIEPAEVPTRPIGPNRLITVITSMLIGLGLAASSAYIIEWIDQAIHSSQEVERILQKPLLGEIPRFPKDSESLSYVNDQPFSPITDSFRSLRTNLEFVGLGNSIKTLLISSPGDSEGKTTISINLALSLAKTKKRVIVIDADFYKSELDEKFNLKNKKGLGDLLLDGKIGKECLIPLFKNQVFLLPSGTTPPNPSEQLGSQEMNRTLEMLKEIADVIIIDGPPFIISDALVLSAQVDGVLVVVSLGKSRRDVLQKIKSQLLRAKANVVGYIVNGISPKSAYYYSHYYYAGMKKENSNGKTVEIEKSAVKK
ncbi:MAG: polysaccharide biosynthesis tyrosine autokinase [Chloroflexota bacterium]